MIIKEAYVHVQIDGTNVVAGKIQHVQERGGVDRFYFVYGRSYLNSENAFSIDPRQLPLSDKTFVFSELPLAFQDNGPDDFGRFIYSRLNKGRPTSPLDYHLFNGSYGIGCLLFSNDKTITGRPASAPPISSLETLLNAVRNLEQQKPIAPDIEPMLNPASSLGGARPKALVVDENNALWIAKFNRPNDIFNIAIAEYASMKTAESLGINVAEHNLISINDEHVFLSKRFDRIDRRRCHFLSAYTFMGANEARADDRMEVFSYPALAHMLKRISSSPNEDRKELFKRMIFNLIVGNRDDHLKNHGFIKDAHTPLYRLSPAYDVVPGANSNTHAIGLGTAGALATIDNALSRIEAFGITEQEGLDFVAQAKASTVTLIEYATENGMAAEEIKILKQGCTTE